MIISTAYFLISIALSAGFNLEIFRDTVADNTTASNSSEMIIDTSTPDYLIRISGVIDNSKVPVYLSNLILAEPSKYNITSDDILTLYGLKEIHLHQFKKILNNLNISSASVLSIHGFETFLTELELNFNDVYGKIAKELSVDPIDQLNFLGSVGVDAMTFSFDLQFGDGFVEFRKGNFSEEVFLNALKRVNRTTEQVFDSCSTQIVNGILKKFPNDIFSILQKYGIDNSKLAFLLRTLSFDPSKPHEIGVFDHLLHNFLLEIDNKSPVGVLTHHNQLIINRGISELFQNKPIKMTVQRFDVTVTYPISIIQNSSLPDIMLAAFNKTASPDDPKTYATLASTKNTLRNCVLFSMDINKTVISEIVPIVENFGSFLQFNSTTFSSKLPLGSPLVCSDRVYGLAKDVSEGVVTLNTFSNEENVENNNILINAIHIYAPNASKIIVGNSLFVVVLFLLQYLAV